MSIEVIRRGTPPAEKPWTGTCQDCHSHLKASRGDVRGIAHGDQRDPGSSGKIDCPVCGATVWVYEAQP